MNLAERSHQLYSGSEKYSLDKVPRDAVFFIYFLNLKYCLLGGIALPARLHF